MLRNKVNSLREFLVDAAFYLIDILTQKTCFLSPWFCKQKKELKLKSSFKDLDCKVPDGKHQLQVPIPLESCRTTGTSEKGPPPVKSILIRLSVCTEYHHYNNLIQLNMHWLSKRLPQWTSTGSCCIFYLTRWKFTYSPCHLSTENGILSVPFQEVGFHTV